MMPPDACMVHAHDTRKSAAFDCLSAPQEGVAGHKEGIGALFYVLKAPGNGTGAPAAVVAISIRTSKFRMGLLNDDRLAGPFKLRMDQS
jgi:hypothetical protein